MFPGHVRVRSLHSTLTDDPAPNRPFRRRESLVVTLGNCINADLAVAGIKVGRRPLRAVRVQMLDQDRGGPKLARALRRRTPLDLVREVAGRAEIRPSDLRVAPAAIEPQ